MLQCARLLIEVSLDWHFPEYMEFINDFNSVVRQSLKYEWKPIKCHHSHMFGHTEDDRKRKKQTRKEGRVVTKETT